MTDPDAIAEQLDERRLRAAAALELLGLDPERGRSACFALAAALQSEPLLAGCYKVDVEYARTLEERREQLIDCLDELIDDGGGALERLALTLAQIEQTLAELEDCCATGPLQPLGRLTYLAAERLPGRAAQLSRIAAVPLPIVALLCDGAEIEVAPELEQRLRAVARAIDPLSRCWTREGVAQWFDRPRRELDGLAPRQLLADPLGRERVVRLARHRS